MKEKDWHKMVQYNMAFYQRWYKANMIKNMKQELLSFGWFNSIYFFLFMFFLIVWLLFLRFLIFRLFYWWTSLRATASWFWIFFTWIRVLFIFFLHKGSSPLDLTLSLRIFDHSIFIDYFWFDRDDRRCGSTFCNLDFFFPWFHRLFFI